MLKFLLVFLISTASIQAQPLSINDKGILLIDGSKKWVSNDFKAKGFKVNKDTQVYVSEGELSHNSDDYDIDIKKNGKYILYFEIRDKTIYRAVLLDNSVPLILKKGDIFVGNILSKAVSMLGKYTVDHGEDIGSYLIFNDYKNFSFYTECTQFSWELNFGLTDKKLNDVYKDGLKKCKIKKILFWGDQKRIWK